MAGPNNSYDTSKRQIAVLFKDDGIGAGKSCLQQGSDVEDSYPLSALQSGMLFHALLEKGSGIDIEQSVVELHETVDVHKFQCAWRQIVSRHPILRTSFRWEDLEQAQQQVHAKVELPWEEQDWSTFKDVEREKRFAEFLAADRRRGFDMERAPLFRLTLLHYGETDNRLIWTNHHILLDGRSRTLLLQELFAYYAAFLRGENISLPQPRPFRDYIDWLNLQDFSKDELFWRQRLKGFFASTRLNVDHATGLSTGGMTGPGSQNIKLSMEITSALRSLAEGNGFTLNTILQGAWAILLSRYNGEADVVFGVVRSNRAGTIEGAEEVIGLCINALPIRVYVNSEVRLLSLLKDVRAQWTALRDHAHTPLAKVQGWSDVPAAYPLFSSFVNFQSYHLDTKWRTQGGEWSNRRLRINPYTNYLLGLSAYDGAELDLAIRFDRSRIEDDIAGRMLGHLRTLLEGMAANPECKVGELPLLPSSERHQLLVEWNETEVDYPQDKCLHQLFEAQAEYTPDAIALAFEDAQITYCELNRRANQLARYLRKLGVGPETLVGICAERSPEMVVGLLAILKAGGAYVPIDPEYPAHRQAFMLQDAPIPVLLTQARFARSIPNHSALILQLDADWTVIGRESRENADSAVTTSNLAYVIYTSGSTGHPKGVMNTHAAIVNRLLWMQDAYPIGPTDTVLQKTPFTFDVSVWEFFWPLMTGARLVLAVPGGHRDSTYVANLVAREGVTTLHFVPSMLDVFLQEKERGSSCATLKRVFCSGETLPTELQNRFFSHLSAELYNLYGPTEAAVDVTYWACRRDSSLRTVPIGRPIANTKIYILDSRLAPVPVGVPGELHIGGIGLARGYLNRPELTREKFIPDPFSQSPQARLYKTGDLARYRLDGAIEYLGRLDFQVKLRGHRIELGEIESVLKLLPGVREAVVVARDDMPGDRRLVAYVAPASFAAHIGELRQSLKERLPPYMLPSAFVFVDAFPLSPNGKLDRKALPSPGERSPELECSYVAPRTPTEEVLANVWCDVLNLKQVSIQDNFFELGGHSLLAVQLRLRIQRILKTEISLATIYRWPTIEGIALNVLQQQVEALNPEQAESIFVELERIPD